MIPLKSFQITILDGKDGRPIERSFKTSIPQHTSPLTISMKGKGKDHFIVWSGDCLGHEGEGGRFGVLGDQEVRFDACDVRFRSKEFNRLSLVSDKFKLKGKTMYNSSERSFLCTFMYSHSIMT